MVIGRSARRETGDPRGVKVAPDRRELVGERRAAGLLCLSVRTLQKWRLQGAGPRFLKLGHAVRYDVADLEAFIAENKKQSTSS